MISKEQFLTIKRLKQEGVPIAAIARRIGISEPTTRKWANMSEAGFDELKKDDIPYLDNYREFILSILRVCPQTRETNILYRLREEFPDFELYMEQLVSLGNSYLACFSETPLTSAAS